MSPSDAPAPAPDEDPLALTLAAATARGLTRNQVRTRAWRHPWRNVYLSANACEELAVRCAAVALVLPPEARFSHTTAAELLGAGLVADGDLHVSVPAGITVPRRRAGVVTHQRVRDEPPLLLDGLAVSCPEQTFLDLAPLVSRADLLAIGDQLVNHWTTQPRLTRYLVARPGLRGVVRARQVAELVRPGTDSPQESRLRLHIVDAGLPEPEVNRPRFDAVGGWLGSPDLGYEEYQVAAQFEGDVHRTSRTQWRKDIARDEAFRDAGWLVLRATGDDVARPGRFLHRLTRALVSRGYRPPPSQA